MVPVETLVNVIVAPKPTKDRKHSHNAQPIHGSPLIKALDTDDITFIFDTTLRPEHRENATVLAFIREYVQSRDLKQTAQEVGISYRDATSLRSRKDIFECISKITEAQVLKYGIDAEEIVKKVWDVADFDPASVVEPSTGAAITNVHDIPVEARRAIKKMVVKNLFDVDENGIKTVIGEVVTFEFWDKLKASEMVGREFGKFKESVVVEHGPTKDMKEILLGGLERASRAVEEIGDGED